MPDTEDIVRMGRDNYEASVSLMDGIDSNSKGNGNDTADVVVMRGGVGMVVEEDITIIFGLT